MFLLCVSCSIARDVEQIPPMIGQLRVGNDDADDSVFITKATGVAGGLDGTVTEVPQGLAAGLDSDNDSTESGFSEQD